VTEQQKASEYEIQSTPDQRFEHERHFVGCDGRHTSGRSLRYVAEANSNPAWVKIRNRRYSQMIGRDELFERRYEEKGE
jgi:hypothetical protein